jgi:hypothetical protein
MYPDPEAFNPLRWVDESFPTFKGPLTQYPTILNMSQFGYGRRTCQGQTVTEADLVAGIGSMAWLFDISKESPQEKRHQRTRSIMMNTKATISCEELVTGMSEHSDDDFDDIIYPTVGAFPAPTAEERMEQYEEEQRRKEERHAKEDPTLRFSKLLIAKPIPFKFHMSVRSEKRAELVHELFAEKVAEGEFPEPKTYWGEKSGQPAEFGWVPT